MPNLKPYYGATKLVVAFDIGTTHSGISYCILERGRVPEILGVTRFPAQALVDGEAKIPSLLYYDDCGHVRAVGAEVLTESIMESALTEGWIKAEWWKLHLHPQQLTFPINLDNYLPPLPPGKSAVDILTDFIKYLFQCVKTYIQEHHLAFSWPSVEGSIEYTFTHPNGWDGTPRQLYLQAIERAGLTPSTVEERSRVCILTEGEASLHFCVQNFLNTEMANHDLQGVVIIDAGRRSIGLSMFSVTLNPISCKEIAPPECIELLLMAGTLLTLPYLILGRLQGSDFVTRRAKSLIEGKLEGWEHSSPDEIAEFTREFDRSTKLVIKSDQEPAYIRVGGRRYNNAKYGITFGKLKLTGAEATGLFSDSIDAIISAFEQQLKSVKIPISMAFLLGGLSTNDWVWSRLQSYFKDKNINISRPDNHINKAVASGAILIRIDRLLASSEYSTVCVLPVKENVKEHVHRKGQWEIDPAGSSYPPGYFESNFRQIVFRKSCSLTTSNPGDVGVQTVRIECYGGSLSDPKQDPSSFSTLCTIRADLSEAVDDMVATTDTSGGIRYQLDYDVIITFGLAVLQAQVGWKTKGGERRISATVL